MLVGVSLVVFGLFALVAAVVEAGAARAAQAKLQDAVDLAAREGLRARDLADVDPDLVRRAVASDLVRLTFDGDLDLGTADPDLQLGAGGIVPLDDLAGVGGAGGFEPATIGRYVPAPALNAGNEGHGDLVAGTFVPGAPAGETAAYERLDFLVAGPGAAAGATAFLARARRTTDALGLDAVPGVSTSGPPLPYLFGLGTTSQPVAGSGTAYDPRRDGITVRATAIADARPALAASLGPDGAGLLELGSSTVDGGTLAVALDAVAWSALAAGDPLAFEASAGQLLQVGTGAVVGSVVAVAGLAEVGDVLPVTAGLAPSAADALASTRPRPVLLARTEAPGSVRVVALGAVDVVTADADPVAGTLTLSALRAPQTLAPDRASLRAPGAWLALEAGGPAEIPGLRAAFEATPGRLLAPALVR